MNENGKTSVELTPTNRVSVSNDSTNTNEYFDSRTDSHDAVKQRSNLPTREILIENGVSDNRPESANDQTSTPRSEAAEIDEEKQIGLEISSTNNSNDAEETEENNRKSSAFKSLGFLDRFLFIWIILAMAVGIILGNFVPNTGPALQKGQFIGVSIPIAIGLILMIYPILCNIEYEVLHLVFQEKGIWKQIGFSLFINWIIGPFLMLGLAWAFLPDEPELREGLILVGLARCIAMVLIWNGLAGGDTNYGAILVSINSILQMVLYAPYALFMIKIISHSENIYDFSYEAVAKSVAVFLGIPLAGGLITRFGLRPLMGKEKYDGIFMEILGTLSLIGLLFTILILFASQGAHVVKQIVSVVRVAAPMIIYFNTMFFLTLFISWKLAFGYRLSVTQSFTAASNNFELAIAIAVATFGHDSNQALAATVGPLTEVPILLTLVYVVRWIGSKYSWKD